MDIRLPRLLLPFLTLLTLATVTMASTLETMRPVTLAGTITTEQIKDPVVQSKGGKTSTTNASVMKVKKFTTKQVLEYLEADGTLDTTVGYSLSMMTNGTNVGLYAVKKNCDPILLDESTFSVFYGGSFAREYTSTRTVNDATGGLVGLTNTGKSKVPTHANLFGTYIKAFGISSWREKTGSENGRGFYYVASKYSGTFIGWTSENIYSADTPYVGLIEGTMSIGEPTSAILVE